MKIVFANNYLNLRGGAERVLFDEVEHLRRNSVGVTVFGRGDVATASPARCVTHTLPPMIDFQAATGWQRVRAARNLIYNADTGRRFSRLLLEAQPDLVHCHNIYGGLTTAILDACREGRIPAVLTLHDYKLACAAYTMLRRGKPCSRCVGGRFYHCVLGRCHKGSLGASLTYTAESYFNHFLRKYHQATLLVAPSRFLLDRMVDYGLPKEKLRFIPNGIDTNRFQPAYGDSGYGLYLGRLSAEKGLGTMLRAARGLSMPLRIVGDGPERGALERQARELNVAQVCFEGHKSGRELDAVLKGAAFIVVPSEWYENAPMSVLEAMAYGKPVVASRIGGIPEQVQHGVTGLLFEPGNSEDLLEAMRALELEPDRRRAMGRAARDRVERHFSLDLHCTRLAQLYREAICG